MNFGVKIETSNEFFVGNLNKTKTRDEIFQDLTNIEIECLKEKLYITKFNMPKFNARKDQNGNLLLNLGYAFVTTKKPEMAQELIRKKRMLLEDGTDIEFKPISKTKRLQANQACKNKNATKISELVEDKKIDFGPIGSRRKSSSTESLQNNYQSGVQSQFVKNSSFNNFPTYSDKNDFMIGNFGDSVFNDFSSQNSSSQNLFKPKFDFKTAPASLNPTMVATNRDSDRHYWGPYFDSEQAKKEINSTSIFDLSNFSEQLTSSSSEKSAGGLCSPIFEPRNDFHRQISDRDS